MDNLGSFDALNNISFNDNGVGGAFTNEATGTLRALNGNITINGINFINNGGALQTSSGKSITLNTVNATFNEGTRFTGTGQTFVRGGATFSGGFTVADGTSLELNNNAFIFADNASLNAGKLIWTDGANLDGRNTSNSLTNNATIQAIGHMDFYQGANLVNDNVLEIVGDYGFRDVGSTKSTVTNHGLISKTAGTGTSALTGVNLTNATDGVIQALSGTVQLANNFDNQGTLAGTASIATSQLVNSGRLAPGEFGGDAGTLTLNGNYQQTAVGLLEIDFAWLLRSKSTRPLFECQKWPNLGFLRNLGVLLFAAKFKT